jgi:hypothetical protein
MPDNYWATTENTGTMMTCINCGQEKPDGEKGRIPLAARIGIVCLPFIFTSSPEICKDCARKCTMIGYAVFFLMVVALSSAAFEWLSKH